jgi:hypothetical protein
MIVNSLKDGWEILYQRSHANLAAMLLAGWRQAERVPRWTELLIATAQHDDQEMFWQDSGHLTDIGAPIHFTEGDLDTSRIQAQLVIDNAYRQGVWIALMISRHNSYLYEPRRGEDAKLDAFLDRQKADQAHWRKLIGVSKKEMEDAYSFLQWADRMSLILCCRELPADERELDVAPTKDGMMVRVMQRADGTLKLTPWVFESSTLKVSVEARRLFQLQFDSEAAFRKALDAADLEIREWEFRR